MTDAEKPGGRRHIYVVEGRASADGLSRVIGLFVVQDARLDEARYDADAKSFTLRIVAGGLGDERADHLARRLRLVPQVERVAVGWREPPA